MGRQGDVVNLSQGLQIHEGQVFPQLISAMRAWDEVDPVQHVEMVVARTRHVGLDGVHLVA